jgi:hypothetical protein
MTGEIFDALELRFDANETLVAVGRKLFQGFNEERVNGVRPYTEVNIERTGKNLGTFDSGSGSGSDIDEWDLRFRYHAKDQRTIAADVWLGAMRALFKDSNLSCFAFHGAGVMEAAVQGPRLGDASYDAAIRFLATIQWRVNSPLVRYA